MKKIMVACGIGFIGSAVVRQFIAKIDVPVININRLAYAAWNDPDPAIARPAADLPRVSGKDQAGTTLSQAEVLS
jgi:dTDP-D-glucose 4,6-dehydratase